MDEIQRIIESYKKRDITAIDAKQYEYTHYRVNTTKERERCYEKVIKQYVTDVSKAKIIEIGAGDGINLHFFKHLGFHENNIYLNELRPNMEEKIKANFPNSFVHIGDSSELPFKNEFDVCFQSTVFTSILSTPLKEKIASKMYGMTKPGGIVLWYDFIYDNPWNKDVKGVKKSEVKSLFPMAKKITFHHIMLAPPIGRRVGPFYPIFNFIFPFLRSHIVAVIEK